MKLTKDLDVSRVFLTYLSLQGDVNRTALALDMEPGEVSALATSENWKGKLDQFATLKENDSNLQIQLNRSLNYVQARQLASLVDGVIKHLSESPETLIDALTTTTRNGTSFETKPISDLVKAAYMIQEMTCRALGDTAQPISDDKQAGGMIGLNVARALNAVEQHKGVDAVTIVKKSLDNSAVPNLPAQGAA